MTDATEHAEPEFLTVRELAALLRVKERKIYDLAASGSVPCSRVTGKLLFPEAAIRDWIAGGSTGAAAAPVAEGTPRPAVFLGSHDPLLEWALRESRCGLATFLDGSIDGLARFRAREGVATGLHLYDADGDDWNVPAVAAQGAGEGAVLVSWARRQRGLALARGGALSGLGDLPGHRFAARQEESGSQALFRQLCDRQGVDPDSISATVTARSENDAVMAVAQGQADAAFGLQALTQPYGLRFVPLIEERFDLLVSRRDWFDGPMQRFLAFCETAEFRTRAAGMAGYDLSDLFKVRWNA